MIISGYIYAFYFYIIMNGKRIVRLQDEIVWPSLCNIGWLEPCFHGEWIHILKICLLFHRGGKLLSKERICFLWEKILAFVKVAPKLTRIQLQRQLLSVSKKLSSTLQQHLNPIALYGVSAILRTTGLNLQV